MKVSEWLKEDQIKEYIKLHMLSHEDLKDNFSSRDEIRLTMKVNFAYYYANNIVKYKYNDAAWNRRYSTIMQMDLIDIEEFARDIKRRIEDEKKI